jgi:hypothetical protein
VRQDALRQFERLLQTRPRRATLVRFVPVRGVGSSANAADGKLSSPLLPR